jgi:hypothetical protein
VREINWRTGKGIDKDPGEMKENGRRRKIRRKEWIH